MTLVPKSIESSTISRKNDNNNNDDDIRNRLLSILGIYRNAQVGNETQQVNNTNGTNTSMLRKDVQPVFQQSLNDSEEEQKRAQGTRRGHHVRRPSRKRIVQFVPDVTVLPIESHRVYSKRLKKTLWTDSEELQDLAYRNQMEFAAEGYDYKQVLEDEEFYMDAETGELVHPFWIDGHNCVVVDKKVNQ
jgi:hypothetical protein